MQMLFEMVMMAEPGLSLPGANLDMRRLFAAWAEGRGTRTCRAIEPDWFNSDRVL